MGAVERGIAGKFANRFENFEAVLLSVSGEIITVRGHMHIWLLPGQYCPLRLISLSFVLHCP